MRRALLSLAATMALTPGVLCHAQGASFANGDDKAGSTQSQASSTVRVRVRAEDLSGKPLADAKGFLFKMTPPQDPKRARDSEPAITSGEVTSASSSDGYVETQPLPAKTAYVLEIQADEFAPELTQWTHPQQSDTVELPPVRLKRWGTITGTVVDRQGQIVPRVTVIQAGDGTKRLEAVTDDRGQFRLGEIPEGRAIVCFDAPGFRFHGLVLTSPSDGARIELERVGDPNPRVLQPATASVRQWSAEQRAAAVSKILDPQIARVLTQSTISENDQSVLLAAARRDPERVLARLDGLKFAAPNIAYSVRYSIGAALLNHGKPDAALEAIGKFKTAQMRLQAYLYWFSTEPAKTKYPNARRSALKKAREILDSGIEPAGHPYQLCELGAQLYDVGDQPGARKVFQECEALLGKMPADDQSRDGLRVQLAIAVARDDVERAKKLAADAEPDELIRAAADIARHHPQDVENFLAEVPGDLSLLQLRGVANNLPPLCLRVARHDPAAAERLLLKYARVPAPKTDAEKLFGIGGTFGLNLSKEFIEFQVTKLKAVCYGLIAEGSAAHDPAAARHALAESIDLLEPLRAGFVYPMTEFYHSPAVPMALLVPTAERLDPALAREIFWRALSLRIAMSGESHERQMLDIDTCLLANLVRLYDRPLGAFLLEPVVSRTRSRTFGGIAPYYWTIRSLALDSPERALAWADTLCDRPTWNGFLVRNSARQVICSVLSSADGWDADRSQQVRSELETVRSVYGVYIARD
ncbi:MAG TPA: carboxypeptidase-like regulatory domain-containing protein [Planctomycetaceae bacterium]|nr:carboxypeptidase-like regulatory domain-containing protein [Planctomycetaceae bacterium]